MNVGGHAQPEPPPHQGHQPGPQSSTASRHPLTRTSRRDQDQKEPQADFGQIRDLTPDAHPPELQTQPTPLPHPEDPPPPHSEGPSTRSPHSRASAISGRPRRRTKIGFPKLRKAVPRLLAVRTLRMLLHKLLDTGLVRAVPDSHPCKALGRLSRAAPPGTLFQIQPRRLMVLAQPDRLAETPRPSPRCNLQPTPATKTRQTTQEKPDTPPKSETTSSASRRQRSTQETGTFAQARATGHAQTTPGGSTKPLRPGTVSLRL